MLLILNWPDLCDTRDCKTPLWRHLTAFCCLNPQDLSVYHRKWYSHSLLLPVTKLLQFISLLKQTISAGFSIEIAEITYITPKIPVNISGVISMHTSISSGKVRKKILRSKCSVQLKWTQRMIFDYRTLVYVIHMSYFDIDYELPLFIRFKFMNIVFHFKGHKIITKSKCAFLLKSLVLSLFLGNDFWLS
jgi:hypothetical protein